MAWATVVGMPPLFDRSAVDPRRSRGRAVAPVRTKPAPQQTASKAIVVPPEPAGKDTAWAGKPDIVKDGKPAPTAEKQLAVLADFSSSEEDDVGKEEDMERRGLAVLVPWQAAKYAAEEFAGKIPRSRVEWKHTPESCVRTSGTAMPFPLPAPTDDALRAPPPRPSGLPPPLPPKPPPPSATPATDRARPRR